MYRARCCDVASRHGTLDRRYGDRPGALQENVKVEVQRFLGDPLRQPFRIQQLMQRLRELFDEGVLPDERRVQNYVQNYRARLPKEERPQRARKYAWTPADFRAAAAALPALDAVDAQGVDVAVCHFRTAPEVELVLTSPCILRAAVVV